MVRWKPTSGAPARGSRRRFLQAGGLGGAAALLAACRAKESPSSKVATPPAAQPQQIRGMRFRGIEFLHNAPDYTLQPKSGGTYRFAFTADPPHLDPVLTSSYAMHAVVTPVYNRLMRGKWVGELDPFDPWKVEVTTDLVEKYETPDPQTYTFRLRTGVKFHNIPPLNGRELTADDVKYSYDRFAKTGVWTESFKVIDRIDVPDKATVVIKLKEPAAYFLTSPLAENAILIHPREIVEADGDLKKRAVGTGPLILKEFTPKTRIIWEKNPDYFRKGRPYMDRMEWTLLPDLAAQIAGFRAGQFDKTASGLQVNEIDNLLKTNPDTVVARYDPQFSIFQWAFRMDKAPFNDVRVRRAISMAVDRQLLIKSAMQGNALVMTNFPFSEIFDTQPQPADFGPYYQYNPGEAKKLLDAAGVKDVEWQVDLFPYVPYIQSWAQIAEQALASFGIKLKLQPLEYTTWVERYLSGKYEHAAIGFASPNVLEMDAWTYLYMHSKSPKNAWHIDDPKVDALCEAQRRELDRGKRRAIWKQIWDLELDQCYRPAFPADRGIAYHSPKLHNSLSNQAHAGPESYGNALVAENVWLG
jgi:peptide/nickel transport system substrate-binding protein